MQFISKLKEKLPFLEKVFGGGNNKQAIGTAKVKDPKAVEVAGVKVKDEKILYKAKKDAKTLANPVIDSAILNEEASTPSLLLDTPPELDETLLDAVEPPKSIVLYTLKGLFTVLIIVGLSALLFFTSQLTHYFDFTASIYEIPSAIKTLEDTNEQIKEKQTELNLYKFLQGKLYLDTFSYDGDEYLRNHDVYSNSSRSDKVRDDANKNMSKLRKKMEESFSEATEKLLFEMNATLISEEYDETTDFEGLFENLLLKKLDSLANELVNSDSEEDQLKYKLYRRVKQLVSNKRVEALLDNTVYVALDELGLRALVNEVNDTVVNELSTIQAIKDDRIKWSDVMHRIETETAYVDQYFSRDNFDVLGGIQYTSYDFETSTSKIIITGTTKSFDATNFTLISDLIDRLNESPYFKNVEMRSFTKNGSIDDGFTATLRLNLELQKEALEDEDEGINPEDFPDFLPPPTN